MDSIKTDEKLINRCPKCGDVMGVNVDDVPICACSVPPRSEDKKYCKKGITRSEAVENVNETLAACDTCEDRHENCYFIPDNKEIHRPYRSN